MAAVRVFDFCQVTEPDLFGDPLAGERIDQRHGEAVMDDVVAAAVAAVASGQARA